MVHYGTDDGFLQLDALCGGSGALRAYREWVRATIDLLTAFLESETGEHDYPL